MSLEIQAIIPKVLQPFSNSFGSLLALPKGSNRDHEMHSPFCCTVSVYYGALSVFAIEGSKSGSEPSDWPLLNGTENTNPNRDTHHRRHGMNMWEKARFTVSIYAHRSHYKKNKEGEPSTRAPNILKRRHSSEWAVANRCGTTFKPRVCGGKTVAKRHR